jgi:hypothetical protein
MVGIIASTPLVWPGFLSLHSLKYRLMRPTMLRLLHSISVQKASLTFLHQNLIFVYCRNLRCTMDWNEVERNISRPISSHISVYITLLSAWRLYNAEQQNWWMITLKVFRTKRLRSYRHTVQKNVYILYIYIIYITNSNCAHARWQCYINNEQYGTVIHK